MALKKATDPVQKKCETEAINFVIEWHKRHHLKVNTDDIYISWFAFIKGGYRCMVTSCTNQNLFFELSVNKKTNAIQCDCYERYAHVSTNGSNYKEFSLTNRRQYPSRMSHNLHGLV